MLLQYRESNGLRAFTLVEMMTTVAIIGLVLMVAVPSFIAMRNSARVARFADTLQTLRGCVEEFVIINRGFPANVGPATVPAGMASYVPRGFDWTSETPLGGHWNWDLISDSYGFNAGIGISVHDRPVADQSLFEKVDVRIDDGNLATGAFRRRPGGYWRRYIFVLQENENEPWGEVP